LIATLSALVLGLLIASVRSATRNWRLDTLALEDRAVEESGDERADDRGDPEEPELF